MNLLHSLFIAIYYLRVFLFGRKLALSGIQSTLAIIRFWSAIVLIFILRLFVLTMNFYPDLKRHSSFLSILCFTIIMGTVIWAYHYYPKHQDLLVERFLKKGIAFRVATFLVALSIPLVSFLSIFWKYGN